MNKRMNMIKAILFSCILILFMLLFIKNQHAILFSTNDDVGMRNFVSGSYNGTMDAHLIYIQYPIGFFLKLLYRLNHMVPWYAFMQVCINFLFVFCVSFFAFRKCDRWYHYGITGLILILIFYQLVIANVVLLQFTTTSAIAAATGIILLFAARKHQRQTLLLILSLLCLLLSYMLRKQVFYMATVFLIISFVYDYRNAKKTMLLTVIALCIGIGVVTGISTMAYSSDEWKAYLNYNSDRSSLMDYYGIPPYESNKAFYEQLDISKEEVALLENYCFILSDHLSHEAIGKIAEYAKQQSIQYNQPFQQIQHAVKSLPSTLFAKEYAGYNLLLFCLFIMLCIWRKKERGDLVLGFLTLTVHVAILLYLLYMGRMPQRVGISLYMMDSAVLIAILLHKEWHTGQLRHKEWSVLIAISLCLLFHSTLLYQSLQTTVSERMTANMNYQKLITYCKEHEDKTYFYDVYSVARYTDAMISPNEGEYMNYISFGGWSSFTPLYADKLADKGIQNVMEGLLADDTYIIAERGRQIDYITDYYASENHAVELELVTSIQGSTTVFDVLKLMQN